MTTPGESRATGASVAADGGALSQDVSDRVVPGGVLLLIAAVLLPLFLWLGHGGRDLWAPDEPRFGLVAQEMQARHNFWIPTVNGEIYAHKPPMLFWLMHLASGLTGSDPGDGRTARLPSAVASVGTVVLTGAIGTALFGAEVGGLSALVLATSALFVWEAHTAQMDALLTFFVTLALYFLVVHRRKGTTGSALGFALACAAATLTKGPVGFLIPWGVAAFWRTPEDKSPDVRRGLFNPLYLLVFALPVLIWLGCAASYGGLPYLQALLGKNVMTRYFDAWHHIKPWHYYLHTTPASLFPWTVFLPAAIAFAVTSWKGDRQSAGIRFAGTWVLLMLVFFSATKGKRGVYMLPSFPALAMLVAVALDRAHRSAGTVRKLVYFGYGLLVIAALAVPPLARKFLRTELGSDGRLDLTGMKVALGLAALALLWAVVRPRVRSVALATLLSALALNSAFYGTLLAQLNPHKSTRSVCEVGLSMRHPGERLGFYGVLLEAYILYSGEQLVVANTPAELVGQLTTGTLVAYLQIERLPELKTCPQLSVDVLHIRRVGDKTMAVVRLHRRS
jgi:4-amino-4-deoxy-L-arabinose transferase-like glycosyltransferase